MKESALKKVLWISYGDLGTIPDKATWLETSKYLNKIGYEVSLVTPSLKQIRYDSIRIISIPLGGRISIRNAIYGFFLLLFLPIHVLRSKYDFVIAHAGLTALSVVPLSFLPISLKPIMLLDSRSPPILVFGIGGYLKKLAYKISFLTAKKFFDRITTITPKMKKDICNKFNLEPSCVGVWPSGVSTEKFNQQKFIKYGESLRKKFGLKGKFVVFHHGSLSCKADRGLVKCLMSIEILKSKIDNLVLFMLGSGETSALREETTRRQIQDRVVIYGPVEYERVPEFIAMCDVTIVPLPNLPKWQISCPLKLLEYLSMQKAVIATTIAANKYIIGDCKCGIFTPTASANDIAKAIVFAYRNKDKLNSWGAHGRNIIIEKYSFEKVAETLSKYLTRKNSLIS